MQKCSLDMNYLHIMFMDLKHVLVCVHEHVLASFCKSHSECSPHSMLHENTWNSCQTISSKWEHTSDTWGQCRGATGAFTGFSARLKSTRTYKHMQTLKNLKKRDIKRPNVAHWKRQIMQNRPLQAKQTCLKDKREVGEPFCEHCGK